MLHHSMVRYIYIYIYNGAPFNGTLYIMVYYIMVHYSMVRYKMKFEY